MLLIRQQQLDAIAQAMLRAFCRELAEDLGRDFPDAVAPDALPLFVGEAVAAARAYRLDDHDSYRKFAEIALKHPLPWTDAEETRWMHERMLDHRVSSPRDRLLRVIADLEHRARLADANSGKATRFRGGG